MKKKILFIALLLLVSFSLSACGKKDEAPATAPLPEAVNVKVQTVAQSLSADRELSFPGLIVSESEAKIVAKTSGTISGLNVKVGDRVALGQELGKIDDVNSPNQSSVGFNASQVKQARIGVEQAQAAYALARSSYNSLLVSSAKDLRQAEIARDQAAKGQENLANTIAESLKSANLAYETAKIATEQAKNTLDNRRKQAEQGTADAQDNVEIIVDSAANLDSTIINNINSLTAFDDNNNVSIAYRTSLGAMDVSSYDAARNSYRAAKKAYEEYRQKKFSDVSSRVEAVISLTQVVKNLVDDVKILFDKSVSSSVLPQTSATGVSLSGLQSNAASFQTQISATLSQISGAKQLLTNTALNNDTLIDSLSKAYDLAKQQEASAAQNLNNLKSGNISQQDQSGFAVNLAQNQYDNLKVKIESQIAAAKTQLDNSELQYNNALIALQGLYDAHSIISPISGTVTSKMNNGDTVSPGQVVATVSQTDKIKVQFYIDAENLTDLKPGLTAIIKIGDEERLGILAAVSPQADPLTKRFLAEVELAEVGGFNLGSVADVKIKINKSVAGLPGTILLPLSSLEVGQNGSAIMTAVNGKAQKAVIVIDSVIGELARIKTNLSPDTLIIIDGNKLVKEGDAVSYQLDSPSGVPSLSESQALPLGN